MGRYMQIKCGGCGQPLLVTTDDTSVRCTACLTLVPVSISHSDPLVRFHKKVIKTAHWVKDQIHQVSNPVHNHGGNMNNLLSQSQPYLVAPGNTHQGSNMYYPTKNHGYGGVSSSTHVEPAFRPLPHQMPSPSAHGRKRALLCGVAYKQRRYELKGPINDVNCMRYLLRAKYGFPDSCILVLSEEEKDPSRIPTKENMRNAMRWLVNGCQAGDSLVFHFSGHGSQQICYDGDEVDGLDEAIWPLDFEAQGKLVDNEINETIVRPLPKGAKLHAIVDACHSGTVLDLPFVCKMNRGGFYLWENQSNPSIYKGTRGGLAISFSSCEDSQTASDTKAFAGNTSTGAMTYCFIQALECEPGITYGRLLTAMRSSIREGQSGLRVVGPITSLLNKIIRNFFAQEPQLSASEQFDIYRTPFLM